MRYASENGIVYVSLNYRLGTLGFLYLGDLLGSGYETSGNCGILDIVAALNWVQMNIEAFGGDPRRVTVIGNSAGAKCTAALYAIPEADGLFSGAVAQSGATQAIRSQDTAGETARKLLHHLGLQGKEASRILDLPVERIMEAQIKAGPDLSSNLHMFGPVADDIIIPRDPLAYVRSRANLPALLLGTNEDEAEIFIRNEPDLHVPNLEAVGRLFGLNGPIVWSVYQSYASKIQPQEAWKKALTEHIYTIGTIQFANAAADSGAAVWMYRLTYGGPCGAVHGYENGLINQASDEYGLVAALDDPYHVTAEGRLLGRRMRASWMAFMHSGDPNVPELPHWPNYDGERSTMTLDLECRTRTDLPVPAGEGCPHQVWRAGS
ncbi:carboxylesterase family protein [Paenibacillus solisilvae]|uniref:Carboxylic ester hydrolase n=1 Tax=Paenibacillus solisilvae TaxID=2486751 RepID=A0ABW0W3L6_9BACL